VPSKYEVNGIKLGGWCAQQVYHYRKFNQGEKAKITAERIAQLDEIGFWEIEAGQPTPTSLTPFSRKAGSWNEILEELRQYKIEHGNLQVPTSFVASNGVNLSDWITCQRAEYRKFRDGLLSSTMTKQRIKLLDSIGFAWEPLHEEDVCPVPLVKSIKKASLRKKPPARQPNHKRVDTNTESEKEQPTGGWEDHFRKLQLLHINLGHCRVDWPWVEEQRTQYRHFLDGKTTTMTLDRIEKLQSIGFEWK